MNTIRRYRTDDGRELVTEWLDHLKDRRAKARINARILRLAVGNFGDCKSLRDGVFELRVNYGPGYRVYYGMVGKTVVVLLCCGDKGSQDADIIRAVTCLEDFKRRAK
ncbi:MAG: type II toxin-antitoxin system RelE/ParE family toxin [Magnetococcales bacterium]|nr:type II toxin-antitoxin system RelE/ParE family toxin [Magnetococcales bacterium]